jgi:hypothetical protein
MPARIIGVTLAQLGRVLGIAWGSYTPTVAPSGGAITTSSATGNYILLGKIFIFRAQITVTTNGTGSGTLNFTIPTGITANGLQCITGRESLTTGKVISGTISNGASTFTCTNYDNTYPAVDNTRFNIGGIIEVA